MDDRPEWQSSRLRMQAKLSGIINSSVERGSGENPGRSGTIGPRPVGKQFKAEEKQEEEAPREKRA